MNQRDYMRMLYQQHNGNNAEIIDNYALAEEEGIVTRASNAYDLTPIQYARRLLKDGIRKRWIFI